MLAASLPFRKCRRAACSAEFGVRLCQSRPALQQRFLRPPVGAVALTEPAAAMCVPRWGTLGCENEKAALELSSGAAQFQVGRRKSRLQLTQGLLPILVATQRSRGINPNFKANLPLDLGSPTVAYICRNWKALALHPLSVGCSKGTFAHRPEFVAIQRAGCALAGAPRPGD